MDKNIAALVRKDIKTVKCVHDLEVDSKHQRQYTWITDLNLKGGDLVVVEQANGILNIVKVASVDDIVDIPPQSSVKFLWVVSKVDIDHLKAMKAKNKEIEDVVRTAYVERARQAFADQVCAGISGPQQEKFKKLIGV